MQEFGELKELIEKRIASLNYSKAPQNLYNPISYTLNSEGKRIRPILTLLACNMFSENIEDALNPAVGIEVFHNFTLLHDDIMDAAIVRRGKPTVHVKWNANTAILSGDTMMVEAYKLVSDAPSYCLREVLTHFSEVSVGVCEGQMYDMEFEERLGVSAEEYLEMIRLKTSVLIAGALKIGALIGKANTADAENMYHFGLNLGISFQLLDDWLDAYGDSKVFGKKTGGDIVSNKKTLLLIEAFDKADKEQKEILLSWINKTDFDEQEKIQAVKSMFNQLKVDKLVLDKAKDYSNKAFEFLDKINVSDDKKLPLRNLGNDLLKRIK